MGTVLLLLPLREARYRQVEAWYPHLPYQLRIEVDRDGELVEVRCDYVETPDVCTDAFDAIACRIEYGLVRGWLHRLRFNDGYPQAGHPYDELFRAFYTAKLCAGMLPESDRRRGPLGTGLAVLLDHLETNEKILRPILTPPFNDAFP